MILIWTGDAPSPLHAVFMVVMILKYFAPRKYYLCHQYYLQKTYQII